MPKLEDYKLLADQCNEPYFNTIVNTLNDHVVRMGIMTAPYPWHLHPDSDETNCKFYKFYNDYSKL